MEQVSVVSPEGLDAVERGSSAPRLHGLEGKTIGEFWNGDFKGDLTFPIIRELLTQRFPGLRIVPFTEFPHHHGSDNPTQQRERARRVVKLAKEMGCDALITGNGA
jgi:hypothetical protein